MSCKYDHKIKINGENFLGCGLHNMCLADERKDQEKTCIRYVAKSIQKRKVMRGQEWRG